MTNENPGTPSMHLFDEEMRKSMPMPGRSISSAPKELMASTMNVLPNSLATRPIASMGLSIPLVVSQWTTETCVMVGSASAAARRRRRRLRFGIFQRRQVDLLHGGHFGQQLAVGSVDDYQKLAPGGMTLVTTASSPNDPLPCMSTAS